VHVFGVELSLPLSGFVLGVDQVSDVVVAGSNSVVESVDGVLVLRLESVGSLQCLSGLPVLAPALSREVAHLVLTSPLESLEGVLPVHEFLDLVLDVPHLGCVVCSMPLVHLVFSLVLACQVSGSDVHYVCIMLTFALFTLIVYPLFPVLLAPLLSVDPSVVGS